MKDANKKSPHSKVPEEFFLLWQWFIATGPEFWIPGLIAIVSIRFFGVHDDLGPAVFIVAFIVVLMVGSVVAVYLFGRSFKRRK